jgi:hypothetical protein
MRKSSRQEVTGLIVNKQIGIDRKELHRFRALLTNRKEWSCWKNLEWKP